MRARQLFKHPSLVQCVHACTNAKRVDQLHDSPWKMIFAYGSLFPKESTSGRSVARWTVTFSIFLGVNSTNRNYHLEIKIPHERLIPRRLQLLRFTYTESLTPIHRVFCISMSVTLPHLNKYKCTIRTNKRGMRSRYFPFFGVPLNSSLYNPNRT